METLKVTKTLARKVETTAKQMNVSSSELVSIALEDFIERQKNKNLLEAINKAYADEPSENETKELHLMKNKSAKVFDEWK